MVESSFFSEFYPALTPQDWEVLQDPVMRLDVTRVRPLQGGVNHVFFLESPQGDMVAKYPKTDSSDAAFTAPGEAARLELVGELLDSGRITLPVAVPRLVEYNPNNHLRIMTALLGLSERDTTIPVYQGTSGVLNGRILGQIAAGLASIPPQDFMNRAPNPLVDWGSFLDRLSNYERSDAPMLTQACHQAAAEIMTYYPRGITADEPIVILSDLRQDNVLAEQQGSRMVISGLVDLEWLVMGDEARFFRFLYSPDELHVLDACLDAYEETSGKRFDRQAMLQKIGCWARTSNLLMFITQLERPTPFPKLLLQAHLRLVGLNPPAEKWQELLNAVEQRLRASGSSEGEWLDYKLTFEDNLFRAEAIRASYH